MSQPFIIFSLPRSRSAWLSHYLTYADKWCGHDTVIDCKTMDEFAGQFVGPQAIAGSCETGAMLGWRVIRHSMPKAKLLVVRRPILECWAELATFGIAGDMTEMYRRSELLSAISALPNVITIDWLELNDPNCCKMIFEHCLELDWNPRWWAKLAEVNIQVDMPRRIRKLQANHEILEQLKLDVALASAKLNGSELCLGLN